MAKKKTDKVRASRDGHEFHEAWAARKALQLLLPTDRFIGMAIEGLSPVDEIGAAAASVEIADLVLFYGKGATFASADRVVVLQFKYSETNELKLFKHSDARKTVKKFAASFLDHRKRHGVRNVRKKLDFELVTNRPIAPELLAAIEGLGAGNRMTGAAKKQADQFKSACKLKASELQEFAGKVTITGLAGSLTENKRQLSHAIADWSVAKDAFATARLGALRDLVRRKAGLAGANRNLIRRADIFAALEVDGVDDLFPCPTAFPSVGPVVERAQLSSLTAKIPTLTKPLLIHAAGGDGKTVLLQSLVGRLGTAHKAILFDCFGGGAYRAPEDARHLPRRGLVHIANTLAAEGLCDPLLPNHDNAEDLIKAFRKRLAQAVEALRKASREMQIILFLDAIDNAAMQAKDRHQDPFPKLLLESFAINGLVPGVQVVATCRPERRDLARGQAACEEVKLEPFDLDETRAYLSARIKKVTQTEIAVAQARSGGNPRILEHLALGGRGLLDPSEINHKPKLDDLLKDQIQRALRDAKIRGYTNEDIAAFLAGLAVLPPPVPLKEYAEAHDIAVEAIQSFANDMAPLLERTKHGLMFRDEPTEFYIRETYATNADALRTVASNLLKRQGESVYAATALPALLQQIGDGDSLFQLAFDDRFPKTITSEIGKRNIRYARLKAAVHHAASKSDYDKLIHILVELSTIAAMDQRGTDYIRENPVLVVASNDADAIRRLFEARTAWPGARHARTAIANILLGDSEEAHRHAVSAIEWLYHYRGLDREDLRDHPGPKQLDVAAIPFFFIAQGQCEDAIRLLKGYYDWYSFEVSEELFELLMHGEANGVVARQNIDKFIELLTSQVGILSGALAFASITQKQRIRLIEKLAAACESASSKEKRPLPHHGRDEHIDDGLLRAAALAIREGRLKEAASILSAVSSNPPTAWSYVDSFPGNVPATYVIEKALRSICAGISVTEWTFLPKDIEELCSGVSSSLDGGQLRSAVLAAIEAAFKEARSDKEPRLSYETKRDLEQFVNNRMERLQRLMQAFEVVMTAASDKVDEEFTKLIEVWGDLSKRSDQYTDRERGALMFDFLGASLVRFGLWARADLTRGPMKELISSLENRLSVAVSHFAQISLLLARRPPMQDLAGAVAAVARKRVEGEDDVPSRASMFAEIGQAILPASRSDAVAYFRIGLEQMDAIGSGDYQFINELLLFADALTGTELEPQDFQAFANICELSMQSEEEKFPWYAFAKGMAAVAGRRMLARLSRWDERDKVSLKYTLLPYLTALLSRKKISSELALCLLVLDDPAELHVCGTGAFAEALHAGKPANEQLLLKELIAQFLSNNSTLPPRSATQSLATLAAQVLGPEASDTKFLSEGAPLFHGLITEQNDHRNYHGIDHRLGLKPEKDDREEKRAALEKIALATDPVDDASMASAIEQMDKFSHVYEYKADFFRTLRAKVPFAERRKYVEIVAKLDGLLVYWKFEELETCKKEWLDSSPGLLGTFRNLVVALIEVDVDEFVDHGSFSGHLLKRVADLGGLTLAEAAIEVVCLFAKPEAHFSAAVWMALASILAEKATAGEGQKALVRLLRGDSPRLANIVPDGAWREGLYPAADEIETAAGMIWARLGAPGAEDRWRAAHSVRCLARLGNQAVIDALVQRMQSTDGGPFHPTELQFYFLHARLWLLIALARIALDDAPLVAKYHDALKGVAFDADHPHVLMRNFASQSLLACAKAGALTLADAERKVLENVDVSPFKPKRQSGFTNDFYKGRPKDAAKPNNEFHLEYDFEKYDAQNLAQAFGRGGWEVKDLIGKWVREFDAEITSMYHNGGRESAHTRRQVGISSHYHGFGHYLAWHGICFAAGELLAKYPTVKSDYAVEWTEWLRRRVLSMPNGLWLSDGMDRTPLDVQLNLLEKDDKSLVLTGNQEKTLSLVGIKGSLGGKLTVYGNWRSSDGVRVLVSSALVTVKDAEQRAMELAKTDAFHAWLPFTERHGFGDEYETSRKSGYIAWIVSPSPEVRLDEDDAWGARSAMARPYFNESIRKLGSLKPTDSFGRSWVDSSAIEVGRADAWGYENRHHEDGGHTGERLVCLSGFLQKVLKTRKVDLLVLVNLQRYESQGRSASGKFTNTTAVVRITEDLKMTYFPGPINQSLKPND